MSGICVKKNKLYRDLGTRRSRRKKATEKKYIKNTEESSCNNIAQNKKHNTHIYERNANFLFVSSHIQTKKDWLRRVFGYTHKRNRV